MTSWTQVHVANLQRGWQQEDMDSALASLLAAADDNDDGCCSWAGQGSTIMKETRSGDPFCFVAFHSAAGAMQAIHLINNYTGNNDALKNLHAELSKNAAKTGNNKKGKKLNKSSENDGNVRLRRKRAPPPPKHPVEKSSAPAKKH